MNTEGLGHEGPRAKYFLIWVAIVRTLLFTMVFHENVLLFGDTELRFHFEDLYLIIRLVTCPSKLGWATLRVRQICVMILKCWLYPVLAAAGVDVTCDMAVERVLNLQGSFIHIFYRRCGFRLEDYYIALPSEIAEEKVWARGRPGVRERIHEEPDLKIVDLNDDDSGWACLTTNEFRRAQEYRDQYPDDVCDIGQEPSKHKTVSSNGVLFTLIKGMGLIWDARRKMWMTALEVWTAQGFPITADAVKACGTLCQFSRGREVPKTRTRASQVSQAGNTIHLNAIGAAIMTSMLCLPPLLPSRDKRFSCVLLRHPREPGQLEGTRAARLALAGSSTSTATSSTSAGSSTSTGSSSSSSNAGAAVEEVKTAEATKDDEVGPTLRVLKRALSLGSPAEAPPTSKFRRAFARLRESKSVD